MRANRIEWNRGYQDPHDPEFRVPYYTAQVRHNLTARIEMNPYWDGDCRRPKCDGWNLEVGNVWIHFPVEKGDRGGRKALAAAKALALRFRLNLEWKA